MITMSLLQYQTSIQMIRTLIFTTIMKSNIWNRSTKDITSEVVPEHCFDDIKAFHENQEVTGNEGVQCSKFYRCAAIMLFRHEDLLSILLRGDAKLPKVEEIICSICWKQQNILPSTESFDRIIKHHRLFKAWSVYYVESSTVWIFKSIELVAWKPETLGSLADWIAEILDFSWEFRPFIQPRWILQSVWGSFVYGHQKIPHRFEILEDLEDQRCICCIYCSIPKCVWVFLTVRDV